MEFIEKTCVGCGTHYLCHSTHIEINLYCTSSCKNNHSLLVEDDSHAKTEGGAVNASKKERV